MENDRIKHQTSETFIIGCILATAGGFLDAYTYLARGKVFANAQTGNMVLMGLAFSKGDFSKAMYYLIPIVSFGVGIYVTECIRGFLAGRSRVHWRQIVLIIEMLLIAVVGIIPVGEMNMWANIIVSFVCALQVESFRKLHGSQYATTMCTGNLRSACQGLYDFFSKRDREQGINAARYFGIIAVFIFGAAISFPFIESFGGASVIACLLPMAAALVLMNREKI